MGVHTAAATTEKRKWWNPRPHGVERFFSKYGQAVDHWEALEELNNLYKKTIG